MKTYLKVPYNEKDNAKKLGAKWDKNKKSWFVDGNKDIAKFNQWIDDNHSQSPLEPKKVEYAPTKPDVILSADELPWLSNEEIIKNIKKTGASFVVVSN